MIHLFGSIVLTFISVHSLRKSLRLYVNEHGVVTAVLSILFAIVGIAAGVYAGIAIAQFMEAVGWKLV